ncbi:hypothetical protein EG329_004817 [Mollisiaceae sp. DMI_Dod_QoI]|nr:hypothetical protein EG329_004817 [Helotiales sp. DMI_Dod_QoI]
MASPLEGIPKYDEWTCDALAHELEKRKLPIGGLKTKLVTRLVNDDAAKLPPPVSFTEEDDPHGTKEQLQIEAEFKQKISAIAVPKAEFTFFKEKATRYENSIQQMTDDAWRERNSKLNELNNKVHGYQRDNIQQLTRVSQGSTTQRLAKAGNSSQDNASPSLEPAGPSEDV